MTMRWMALCAFAAGLAAPLGAATFRELQGDEQFAAGRFDTARALYREALRAEPENRSLWVKYDLAYVRELGGKAAPRAPGRTFAKRVRTNAQMVAQTRVAPRVRNMFEELRNRRALGAPVGPVGTAAPAETFAALRRTHTSHKPEPEFDRETPMEPLPENPAPHPSVPGRAVPEGTAPQPPEPAAPAESAPATPDAAPAAAIPPPAIPDAVRHAPLQIAPTETIPVPPVAPGDNLIPSSGQFGEPIVVRGSGYDIWDLRYGVDLAGRPHVVGKARNLTDRDIVNPTIYVGLVDPAGVQVAFRPVKMEDPAGVVFPGGSRDFDAEFPPVTNPIAGYRVFMLGR